MGTEPPPGIRCRICGLACSIRDTEIGPVLMHLSDAVEADHTAVEDDGSYFETLPPPIANR